MGILDLNDKMCFLVIFIFALRFMYFLVENILWVSIKRGFSSLECLLFLRFWGDGFEEYVCAWKSLLTVWHVNFWLDNVVLNLNYKLLNGLSAVLEDISRSCLMSANYNDFKSVLKFFLAIIKIPYIFYVKIIEEFVKNSSMTPRNFKELPIRISHGIKMELTIRDFQKQKSDLFIIQICKKYSDWSLMNL